MTAVDVYPCIFCTDDNSHARSYPVSGDPFTLYCPTCHQMFDKSELTDNDLDDEEEEDNDS